MSRVESRSPRARTRRRVDGCTAVTSLDSRGFTHLWRWLLTADRAEHYWTDIAALEISAQSASSAANGARSRSPLCARWRNRLIKYLHHPPFIVHHSPFTIHDSPFTIHSFARPSSSVSSVCVPRSPFGNQTAKSTNHTRRNQNHRTHGLTEQKWHDACEITVCTQLVRLPTAH